jgi:hypothetical protein
LEEKLDNVWRYSSINLVAYLLSCDFKLKKVERLPIPKREEKTKIYFTVEGDNQKEYVDKFKSKDCQGSITKFIKYKRDLIGMVKSL